MTRSPEHPDVFNAEHSVIHVPGGRVLLRTYGRFEVHKRKRRYFIGFTYYGTYRTSMAVTSFVELFGHRSHRSKPSHPSD